MQSKVQVAPDSPLQHQIMFFNFPGVKSFVMLVGKPLFGRFSKNCLVLRVTHSNSASFSQFPRVVIWFPWCMVQINYRCNDAWDFNGLSKNSQLSFSCRGTGSLTKHKLFSHDILFICWHASDGLAPNWNIYSLDQLWYSLGVNPSSRPNRSCYPWRTLLYET